MILLSPFLLQACAGQGDWQVVQGQEQTFIVALDRHRIDSPDVYWQADAQQLLVKRGPGVEIIGAKQWALRIDLPKRQREWLPLEELDFTNAEPFDEIRDTQYRHSKDYWRGVLLYTSLLDQQRFAEDTYRGIVLPSPQFHMAFPGIGGDTGWSTHQGLFGSRILTIYPNGGIWPTIQITSRQFNVYYDGYFFSGDMAWLPGGRYFVIVQEPYTDYRILILDAGEPTNNS